jgi:membrane associated rhomboid family serine protease
MVIPLYDDNPLTTAKPPLVTWGLIAFNVTVFLVEQILIGSDGDPIMRNFAAVPSAIFHNQPAGGFIPPSLTPLTSLFVHLGWMHIAGNMIYLWVFGDDIERALGRFRFLAFYLLGGASASMIFVAFNSTSKTPLVGASGAISAVLAAYLMLRPCANISAMIFYRIVRIKAIYVVGFWAFLQVVYFTTNADANVAYLAHIGGFVTGAILFSIMRPRGIRLFQCISGS